MQVALEKQKRLNKSLYNIEYRKAKAIAIEEANILESKGNTAQSKLMLLPLI